MDNRTILVIDYDLNTKTVMTYTPADMMEIYNPTDMADLRDGMTILRSDGTTHVDLVAFYENNGPDL